LSAAIKAFEDMLKHIQENGWWSTFTANIAGKATVKLEISARFAAEHW